VDKPEALFYQVLSLCHSVLYAESLHCLVISFDLLETFKYVGRYHCFCELAHSVEAVVTENGHNSRNDFTLDSCSATVRNPIVENLVIIEKLRDDKVCPSIYFLFQVVNVIFAGSCLEMDLGVAGHSNTEEVPVLFSDELHKVNRVIKAIFCRHPVSRASRRITSES